MNRERPDSGRRGKNSPGPGAAPRVRCARLPLLALLVLAIAGLESCATTGGRGVLVRREFGERTGRMTRTVAGLGDSLVDHVTLRTAKIGRRIRRAGENTMEDVSTSTLWVTEGILSGLADRSRRFSRTVSTHWEGMWLEARRDAELFFARAWEDLKVLE